MTDAYNVPVLITLVAAGTIVGLYRLCSVALRLLRARKQPKAKTKVA